MDLYIYPREDIKNAHGVMSWYKGKRYVYSPNSRRQPEDYLVSCELFLGGKEQYVVMGLDEIKIKFYTTEDHRNHIIEDILK